MLNGDGNENDLISKKKNCTCSTLFFFNQQNNKFTRAARFFVVSLPLFCSITMPFSIHIIRVFSFVCVLTWSLLGVKKSLGHALIGLLQGFNSKFPTSIPTPFTCGVPPGISHYLTAAMKVSCFSSNESRLPSSFSVIHASLNIKNNVEKDTTLLFFSFLKCPGGHAIFFRCIWVAMPVDYIERYKQRNSLNFIRLLRVVFSSQQRLNRPAVNAVQ